MFPEASPLEIDRNQKISTINVAIPNPRRYAQTLFARKPSRVWLGVLFTAWQAAGLRRLSHREEEFGRGFAQRKEILCRGRLQ